MALDWIDFYKTCTGAYHIPGPFYSGPGHHGVDFHADSHQPVPAYFHGVCVENGHSSVLGNYTVFKADDGTYRGYAHCLIGTRRNVGEKVGPGDQVYLAAGFGDDHGSAWTGPHCHTTLSHEIHGIYDGNTLDPLPVIQAARNAALHASSPSGTPAVWEYVDPEEGDIAEEVQRAVAHKGGYTGPIDGKFGQFGREAVQRALSETGYFKGAIDGKIEAGGCHGIQRLAHDHGGYTGPLDNKLGPNSWRGFASGLLKL